MNGGGLSFGRVDDVSLTLRDGAGWDEYEQACRFVGRVGRAWQWWAGDLIVAGEAMFGESAHQAIEEMGFNRDTLATVARVAERIPPSRRRAGLTFSHHEAVVTCDPRTQQKLLSLAVQHGWTVREIREARRAHEALERADAAPERPGLAKIETDLGRVGRKEEREANDAMTEIARLRYLVRRQEMALLALRGKVDGCLCDLAEIDRSDECLFTEPCQEGGLA